MEIGVPTDNDWLWIIYKGKTGFFYGNQSGGHACNHPKEEGALAPVFYSEPVQRMVYDHFVKEFGCWCCEGNALKEEEADAVDEIIGQVNFSLDRSLIGESYEAWLHCTHNVEGKSIPCILCWENSD